MTSQFTPADAKTADVSTYYNLAAFLKAAGDPLRLDILRVLAKDSFGVLELTQIFDIKQSGMSHHLKVLANSGLVATRREGNSIFYRRDPGIKSAIQSPLQDQLFRVLDAEAINPVLAERLSQVQAERAKTSEQYFAQNADKLREQQDLIASYPVYGEQVADLLSSATIPSPLLAIEIGPGSGEFLTRLAPEFSRVIAIDNSETMLAEAQNFARQNHLENITFVHDDTSALKPYREQVDCIVANMVLHHTPSPANIVADLGQALKPGGVLIIAELCAHDQVWARDACGDLWFGFEPDELTHWAEAASLTSDESMFFALRNGFQIQLRRFIKLSTWPKKLDTFQETLS